MRLSRARSASPIRGAIRRRRVRAPRRYFGCSTRAVWLATWCATKLSQVGHRLATTASLGAARRPENGRSRADQPRGSAAFFGRAIVRELRAVSGSPAEAGGSYYERTQEPGAR